MIFDKLFKNKSEQPQRKKAALIPQNGTLIDLLINTGVSSIGDDDMDMILADLTVTQCDVSRKSVTEKKEIQIVCDDEKIKDEFKKIFNPDVVSQILETYLYGLNVFEVNYKEKEGLVYPRLVQRDFRQFKFNDVGEFVFSAGGSEQSIPPLKVIYALNRANFRKVYGDGLLKKLYFPVKMKNASLKFWFRFLEKFGSPWAIAKTSYEPDEMAAEVQAMLSGDSAVIDTDEEITLVQPTSNVDFTRLPAYLDNQISKAILGANLTSDVKEGSYAAAKTHNEIREDLAANDAKILIFVMNKAISFFKEINGYNGEIYAKLFDEDAPNTERATRDKTLYDMGFAPTKKYITSTYNIEIDENAGAQDKNLKANKANLAALKGSLKALDRFDKATDEMDVEDGEIEAVLNKLIASSETYEEAFDKLYELYDLPFERLESLMFRAVANAQMLGYVDEF
ncbi:phage portal protein family protein [Campylobacter concisus]|uniref:phage portal protein family protein n=1 Tax=Campylobacter concisus TaxID=199 RepID=UPI003D195C4E